MKCPNCGQEIKPFKHLGLTVLMCPSCRGIWFEENELEPYLRYVWKACEGMPLADDETGQEQNHDKICPRCRLLMPRTKYTVYSDVILDKCPACKGIWADYGEIETLVKERSEELESPILKKRYDELRDLETSPEISSDDYDKLFFYLFSGVLIPVRDDVKAKTVPFITYSIILINCCVFLFQSKFIENLPLFFRHYGFVLNNALSFSGSLIFITSIFIHGNIIHLAGNMWFLWIFGDNVEDAFGHLYFFGFYILCGIISSLTDSMFHLHSNIPSIGASGAIAGAMGAYFFLYPKAKIKMWIIFTKSTLLIPVFAYLGFWIIIQIASGLDDLKYASGIGWFAHIGGFITGVLVSYIVKNRKAVPVSAVEESLN